MEDFHVWPPLTVHLPVQVFALQSKSKCTIFKEFPLSNSI